MPPSRWAAIVGVASAISLALLGDQMLYVVLPGRPEAAGIGVEALGLVLGANRFVRLGANSIGGTLSDRWGRRPLFLLGMALALVSTLGYLFTSGLGPLLVWRLVWGVAYALISVAGLSIAMDLSTPDDRGRTVGGYHSLVQCGTLLGLVLSGMLMDRVGYRGTLAIYAPLTALGCLVAVLMVGESAPGRRLAARLLTGTPRRPAASGPWLGQTPAASGRALDPRLLLPAYVSFATLFAGSGVLMSTLGLYLRQAAEDDGGLVVPVATLTGILLASRRLAGVLSAPLAGHLSDRSRDRRATALAGAAVALVGYVVLAATERRLIAVVAGVWLTAIGEGVLQPSLAAWVGDAAPPARRGMLMGVLATAADLGAATGPLVAYGLASAAGLARAYTLCAGLMASSVAALVIGRPRRPQG